MRHHRRVWRSLRRLGVPESDADDAAQQVFLVAHRRIADIAPENEQSFLLQTALRVAADFRRSKRRRHLDDAHPVPVLVDSAASPEEMADGGQTRAMLDWALESMPMDLRQVFVLFELEELTMTEVASVVCVPRGTVASRLRRARVAFREIVTRLSSQWSDRREPAVFIDHGNTDTTIDFSRGQAARDLWLETNHCGSATKPWEQPTTTCVSYDGCDPDKPVIWCEFSGGHVMPSWASAAVSDRSPPW